MVTAPTGELRKVIVEDLAQRGCSLVLAARNKEKLDELHEMLHKKYPHISVSQLLINFESIDSIQNAAKAASSYKLHGIVLIAPRPSLSKAKIPEPREWIKTFSECFIGPLEIIGQFESFLQKNSGIVILSGVTSKYYLPSYPIPM